MQQIFTQYAAYNLWANTQFALVVRGITPSYFDREVESSFSSIRATINHIRSAEQIWTSRLQGAPLHHWPPYNEGETPKEVADAWLQGSQALGLYISQINNEAFGKEYAYKDMKGNPHTDVLGNILMHVFNHSTFHRGQLVTLFRQSGIQTIPRTDYIVYAREKLAL